MAEKEFPYQPIYKDPSGVHRFRANAVVEYLLANSGISLQDLPRDLPAEDMRQFNQLIGHSVGGWAGLQGVEYEHEAIAFALAEAVESGEEVDQTDIEIAALKAEVARLRRVLGEVNELVWPECG